MNAGRLLIVLAVAGLATCDSETPGPPVTLMSGTWGGEGTGLIIGDTTAHIHIGCTYGDFPAPIELGDDGRFGIPGEYLLRAYPVAIGPTMPAVLSGVLRGRTVTITVAVNDTIDGTHVTLGPVTATFGADPELGPCPICR